MSEYKARIADKILERRLAGTGAVLVRGPKWCGKTTTCVRHAKSALFMADPDTHDQNLRMAKMNISSLLKGENPRLIDEWQEAPRFWDAVRAKVDCAGDVGQFILTGSAVPPDTEEIVHSGTGRIASMKMRPMSLWESGESSGGVSIGALLDGAEFETAGEIRRPHVGHALLHRSIHRHCGTGAWSGRPDGRLALFRIFLRDARRSRPPGVRRRAFRRRSPLPRPQRA